MRVLDTDIDVAANKTILIGQYKVSFFLLIYSAVLDCLSTMHFLSRIGPAHEANFFVRTLSYTCGIILGPIIGKILQVLAVWFVTLFVPGLINALCATIICANCYAFVLNMQIR